MFTHLTFLQILTILLAVLTFVVGMSLFIVYLTRQLHEAWWKWKAK